MIYYTLNCDIIVHDGELKHTAKGIRVQGDLAALFKKYKVSPQVSHTQAKVGEGDTTGGIYEFNLRATSKKRLRKFVREELEDDVCGPITRIDTVNLH